MKLLTQKARRHTPQDLKLLIKKCYDWCNVNRPYPHNEGVLGSSGIAPFSLHLGARWGEKSISHPKRFFHPCPGGKKKPVPTE